MIHIEAKFAVKASLTSRRASFKGGRFILCEISLLLKFRSTYLSLLFLELFIFLRKRNIRVTAVIMRTEKEINPS